MDARVSDQLLEPRSQDLFQYRPVEPRRKRWEVSIHFFPGLIKRRSGRKATVIAVPNTVITKFGTPGITDTSGRSQDTRGSCFVDRLLRHCFAVFHFRGLRN